MCKKQEKDYSLLRPFDLEEAKKGAPLCSYCNGITVNYIAGPDATEQIAYKTQENRIFTAPIAIFRMAPLCWVEGRPVYKDDTLYRKWKNAKLQGYKINDVSPNGIPMTISGILLSEDINDITWTPPKVKREGWVNIYPKCIQNEVIAMLSDVYASKENANCEATQNRIACVRIEWEE